MLPDGGCLLLQASRGKEGHIRRSWIFRYQLDGRRHDVGLGSVNDVGLSDARAKARAMRQQLLAFDDPLDLKRQQAEAKRRERQQRAAEEAKQKTFEECAGQFLSIHLDSWKNAKHRQQWANTLRDYASPVLGKLCVADIDTPHIVEVLTPIWNSKRETARRVLGRIERILNYAKASGYRSGDNPASWRGHLKDLLPGGGNGGGHHAALPYAELPTFMAELRGRDSLSARALEFTILTAARTGETVGATWDEFDLANKLWTIAAGRMKAGREHKVPLCDRALEILKGLPGRRKGRVFPMGNMAMLELLRGMRPGITTHGFRSSFMDWAHECTASPKAVVDKALAHAVGDKVEAAYRRGDLFAKRTKLMQTWASYCSRPAPAGATVTPIRQAR
jgi:integrase